MSYPEFSPGVNPSFMVQVNSEWPVQTFSPTKPYDQVVPLGVRPVREFNLTWRGLTRDQYDYFMSFFHSIGGQAGVFAWRTTDAVFSPRHAGPTLDEESGGSLAQRTYYVKYTWYDSVTGQETVASPSTSNTVQANYVLTVEIPHMPAGVTEWRVYAHETSGSECLQATVSGTRFWTEPVTGMVTLTDTPPVLNDYYPLLHWRLVGGLPMVKYRSGRWMCEMTWREVWV